MAARSNSAVVATLAHIVAPHVAMQRYSNFADAHNAATSDAARAAVTTFDVEWVVNKWLPGVNASIVQVSRCALCPRYATASPRAVQRPRLCVVCECMCVCVLRVGLCVSVCRR